MEEVDYDLAGLGGLPETQGITCPSGTSALVVIHGILYTLLIVVVLNYHWLVHTDISIIAMCCFRVSASQIPGAAMLESVGSAAEDTMDEEEILRESVKEPCNLQVTYVSV